jgi:hypothetical protein
MNNKTIIFYFVFINAICAQTELKNYLNTGIGLYAPLQSNFESKEIGSSATLNLEAELTKRTTARFSIDTYRIPLTKEIDFNNALVKANIKANITSIGLDYGLHYAPKKWRFYALVGASICFIDEPEFNASNNTTLTLDSKNATRLAIRISPGIKYHFSDTFILFSEFQQLSIFYKNQNNKNALNGVGIVIGIASRI